MHNNLDPLQPLPNILQSAGTDRKSTNFTLKIFFSKGDVQKLEQSFVHIFVKNGFYPDIAEKLTNKMKDCANT